MGDDQNKALPSTLRKAMSLEALVFIVVSAIILCAMGAKMGGVNMINTIIKTAFDLLLNTAFYIMAVAVLAGALSELLQEFGVIAAANKILSPIIRPIFGLPGASMVGICTTYLSDNPAILTFANNKSIRKYYKKYQLPAICNIGTAFGMGLIVSAALIGIKSPIGESFVLPVAIGNIGAIVGAIVSTRLMLYFSARVFGKEAEAADPNDYNAEDDYDIMEYRKVRDGGTGSRFMTASLDGGKIGVDLGIAIIPGILIITTIVMMLTSGASSDGSYTGSAYEGVKLLPYLFGKIDFILKPLFGFQNLEALSIPLTALGAAGAAIGLVPNMVASGVANAHDIAVFTAMCMCFSGYLCTHVVMMQSLGVKELAGKAILSHTVGGICAGIAAHFLYTFIA